MLKTLKDLQRMRRIEDLIPETQMTNLIHNFPEDQFRLLQSYNLNIQLMYENELMSKIPKKLKMKK